MLSSRARYATRAILDLALHHQEGPQQIESIADRQNIPAKYLQQIMMSLKQAGFVTSRKGPGGGYFLFRQPSEITLGAVIRSMDGPLAPISCVSVTRFHECGCPDPDTCVLRGAFREVRDAIADILDHTSFEALVAKQAGGIVESMLSEA
jgi:Rrf2 family protein